MLRGSSQPAVTFSELRANLPASLIPSALRWLPSVRNKGKAIFAPRFPTRNTDLRRGGLVFEKIPIDLEVSWAVHIIRSNAEKINKFLEFTTQFEEALVAGHFSVCETILNSIEQTTGISFWTKVSSLGSLFYSTQADSSLQKTYLAELQKGPAKRHSVVFGALLPVIVMRKLLYPRAFPNNSSTSAHTWPIDADFVAYLVFKITNQFPDISELGDVLRYEAPSALVDYYDTFVRLAAAHQSSRGR